MKRVIFKFFFDLFGWKLEGKKPELRKYIIVVAPHTSNWDFMLGLCTRAIWRFDAKYLAKNSLFKFPFGGLFRWLGGYPVDRSRHTNLVDSVVAMFNEREDFIIAVTPEGTRSYVPKWKTGFYHIAVNAKVPLVLAALDYKSKSVIFSEPIKVTGNFDEDFKKIVHFFKDKKGKYEKRWPEEFIKFK